jgi:stage IV sporulation protein B
MRKYSLIRKRTGEKKNGSKSQTIPKTKQETASPMDKAEQETGAAADETAGGQAAPPARLVSRVPKLSRAEKAKKRRSENERLKAMAGRDAVVLLENWKWRRKKRRIYRVCLCSVLLASCLVLGGLGYSDLYNRLPSVIRLRAGVEQSLDLGLPMEGEVVSAGGREESNIPSGAVTINLNHPVTLTAGTRNLYRMKVRLFGILPFKQVDIQVIEDRKLIPVGVTIGIYVKTEGILVVGVGEFEGGNGVSHSPAKYILKSGDYILTVDGETVTQREEVVRRIEQSGGKEMILTIRREEEIMDVKVKPVADMSGAYKIGIWMRDDAQGVGTMTFIDEDGNFGALGHGINDVDTSTLMEMDDGTLFQTEIIAIKKGASGTPGEMTGMIVYSEDRILGDIESNSVEGIFGSCNEKALSLATEAPLPIGLKQEIQKGAAQILCNVGGTPQYYAVEITAIHLDHDNVNRGIELKVTDPALLAITGGIVQGMSGAPIVQNGKFIGAVTHVLVQDASRGYGIFIENMLPH